MTAKDECKIMLFRKLFERERIYMAVELTKRRGDEEVAVAGLVQPYFPHGTVEFIFDAIDSDELETLFDEEAMVDGYNVVLVGKVHNHNRCYLGLKFTKAEGSETVFITAIFQHDVPHGGAFELSTNIGVEVLMELLDVGKERK